MLFNSIDFIIFFIVVIAVLYLIPARTRLIWLLIASYFFYMCWDARFIALIVASTFITYFCGILLGRTDGTGKRKLILAASTVVNLGLLFFFKYFNFTLDICGRIVGREISPLHIILPVGISFYTFQAVGYTIDCYRHQIEPERNFIRYALFVSFFPQLVAGPIERSKNLLGQIKNLESVTRRELIDPEKIQRGFILMVYGLFLKLVIADRISIFVDNVYEDVNGFGTVGLFLACLGFGLQIYCDFYGYSLIAIGAAGFVGIRLMENFAAPYLATSMTDLWRKWHISLSSWFRDYLYIPLGGSRKGQVRKYINLLIVMSVSGLWHGADTTFIVWGTIHGILLIVEGILKPAIHKIEEKFGVDKSNIGFMFFRAFPVMFMFSAALVVFRADSLSQALRFFERMFTRPDWWILSDGTVFTYGLNASECVILAASVLILAGADLIRTRRGLTLDAWLMKQFTGFRIVFVALLVIMTVLFGIYGPGFDSQQFIYFQF